jgi:hypothetical protein
LSSGTALPDSQVKSARPREGTTRGGPGSCADCLGTTPFPATSAGTGRLFHLGKSTYSQEFTITPTGPTTFSVAGTQTIVAANGDMLFMTFTGTGELAGVFGVGQTSETTVLLTVTGGTGRFADASGSLTSTIFTTIDSIVGATATATQTSRVRGKISY